MSSLGTALLGAAAAWGPPAAEWFDIGFGYGALGLLIALVIWSARNDSGPPPPGRKRKAVR